MHVYVCVCMYVVSCCILVDLSKHLSGGLDRLLQCLCMYVCMYACMCMYVCSKVQRSHRLGQASEWGPGRTPAIRVYVCIYIYVCDNIYTCACMYVNVLCFLTTEQVFE
jgi:hypothetical protein